MVKVEKVQKQIRQQSLNGVDAVILTNWNINHTYIERGDFAGKIELRFEDTLFVLNPKCVPADLDNSNIYIGKQSGDTYYKGYYRGFATIYTPPTSLLPIQAYKIGGRGENNPYTYGETLAGLVKTINYSIKGDKDVYFVYNMNAEDYVEPILNWNPKLIAHGKEYVEWRNKQTNEMQGRSIRAPRTVKGTKTAVWGKKSHRNDLASALSNNFRKML